MNSNLVLFLDDGGVMNDNARRGSQWQRLLGEFFPPRLGGTPEAWAAANRAATPGLWADTAIDRLWDAAGHRYAAFERLYHLTWLDAMCRHVGIPMPPEPEAFDLAIQAADHCLRRVRSAFPGAADAVRALRERGYRLFTASGESSRELERYLAGMGVRDCFERLYGPDLVDMLKRGPEYHRRVFADAGISPTSAAVVVDDSPAALSWAAQAGARTVLVGSGAPLAGPGAPAGGRPDLVLQTLAELPAAMETLGA